MDLYGVMGNPIHHSKSPLIHRLFAEQTHQDIQYEPILVELDGLAEALKTFQARGGKGINITLPFKHGAFGLVDTLSEAALVGKSVNAIIFNEDGRRFGHNTDGVGLVKDLVSNLQLQLRDKRILIVGAGGAVSGVVAPLLKEQPAKLVIANRTVSKAVAVIEPFTNYPVTACGLEDLGGQTFDLVINGTSAGLQNELLDLPASILQETVFCYDMVYGKGVTPFLDWAGKHGVKTYCDGIGMLVEQAAESFYLWRKLRPDTGPVLRLLGRG